MEIPLLLSRTVVACVMVGISLTDVFVVGAGFGVYINNRTWIEGWDVELAFKQLAQRLAKVALVMISFLVMSTSADGNAETTPATRIQEVKADEAFKVHSLTDRIPKSSPPSTSSLPLDLIQALTQIFAVSVIVLLVALLGWVLWRNRNTFKSLRFARSADRRAPSARVVMGMNVSPDTLPLDVPAAAWVLWQGGRHQEALGLLYRGSISRVMELGRVEIQESDTEGDCLRRVIQAGAAVHPDYFKGITGAWVRMAYAGISPADIEVQALCGQWPFGERRLP
jgi:hypothetical protein